MFYLNDLGMFCPLGGPRDEISRRMLELAQSGVAITDVYSPGRMLPLGRVDTALPPADRLPLRECSRNNQLALAALSQIKPGQIERPGPDRISIVIHRTSVLQANWRRHYADPLRSRFITAR
jgi:3-oxoacyl-[acyl-carrier-protein] synthase-1